MVRSFQDCRLYPELSVLDVLMLCEDAKHEVLGPLHHVAAALGPPGREAEAGRGGPGDRRLRAGALPPSPHGRALYRDPPGGRSGLHHAGQPAPAPARRADGRHRPARGRGLHPAPAAPAPGGRHDDRPGRARRPARLRAVPQVVVMELGRVAAAGPPDVVRADPKALAAYLGASDEALLASGPTGTRRPGAYEGEHVTSEGDDEHIVHDPNPLAPVGRTWRRLRRRPRAMQIRTVLIVLAVVVGLVVWLVPGPVGDAGLGAGRRGQRGAVTAASATVTPVSQASTSARGVTAHAINVVFPVVAHQQRGRAARPRRGQGVQRADQGHPPLREPDQPGGRDPRPQDQSDHRQLRPHRRRPSMRALCKQWTQGSPPVFAVIDGIGTWTGDNQLCVTQQGHTPMIGGVDDGHQLDPIGLALPVVDRGRPGAGAQRHRELGAQLGPARPRARRSAWWCRTRPATRPPSTPTCCPT